MDVIRACLEVVILWLHLDDHIILVFLFCHRLLRHMFSVPLCLGGLVPFEKRDETRYVLRDLHSNSSVPNANVCQKASADLVNWLVFVQCANHFIHAIGPKVLSAPECRAQQQKSFYVCQTNGSIDFPLLRARKELQSGWKQLLRLANIVSQAFALLEMYGITNVKIEFLCAGQRQQNIW